MPLSLLSLSRWKIFATLSLCKIWFCEVTSSFQEKVTRNDHMHTFRRGLLFHFALFLSFSLSSLHLHPQERSSRLPRGFLATSRVPPPPRYRRLVSRPRVANAQNLTPFLSPPPPAAEVGRLLLIPAPPSPPALTTPGGGGFLKYPPL